MAKKKRRRRPRIYRSAEVCQQLSKRVGDRRKRIVECAPVEAAPEELFIPHCTNEACTCGIDYKAFRSGWSFADAWEMLGGKTDPYDRPAGHGPSVKRVRRLLGKLKRDEWERHQQACAAGESEDIDWDKLSEDIMFGEEWAGLKGGRKMARSCKYGTYRRGPKKGLCKAARGGKRSWSNRAPQTIGERRKMPASCFLDGKRRLYPVCAAGTRGRQKIDCQGLLSAYRRARQQKKYKLAGKAQRMRQRHCGV